MIQTGAIFLDAYRDLNSRKLFWLAIIVSALGVVIVGALGINERGVSLFGYTFEFTFLNSTLFPPATFYKLLFSVAGIGFWLSWMASILALISTASMIPELIAGGSIDMMLSKPIGRTRLFLTRWSTGLLFSAIQAAVFTTACFLVIGIRGGAWEPSLFLAIPVIVIFFSYLYCVCAFVGLVTRSTIASLIITLLFWLAIFGLQWIEEVLNYGRVHSELEIAAIERLVATKREIAPEADLTVLEADLEGAKYALDQWNAFYWPVYYGVTCLPKTSQTTDWLRRELVESARLGRPAQDNEMSQMFGSKYVRRIEYERALFKDAEDRRGAWWAIGTSLAFEAVVLTGCVLIFKRKDF